MVTFNIVEGSSSDDFYPLYQKIKNDINNNMRVVDIRKKYKLSKSQWHKFHRALKEDNIFYNKDYRQRYAKYYSYNKVNKKYIIYKKINDKQEPVVFILWGNYAKAKKELITNPNHLVLESTHPSPYSASSGFFGSRPFSKTNNYLKSKGIKPIDWDLSK